MTSKATGPEAHTEGNAFYQNQIELITPEYDCDVKTGRALALGADNDLAIEVADGGYVTVYDFIREEFVMYDDTGTEVTPV